MESSVIAGRFFRARLRIHYSWIPAILLISWAVSTQYSVEYAFLFRIISGFIAGVLFLLVIILREYLLIFMAIYKGIDVKAVTVFIFGGLPEVDQKTTSTSHELILSLTGFFINSIISGLFYFASVLFTDSNMMVYVITRWLGFLFFTLTLFHMKQS